MFAQRLFVLLAEYNAHVNQALFAHLGSLPPELLAKPAGSYFDTVLGLLNHLLVTDLGWLNAYRLDTPALDFAHPGWKKPLYDNLADLGRRREAVDAVMGAFAAELTDEVLSGSIVMPDWRGEKHRFVVGEVLLHLFNHQTHHRGAIAQVLDGFGARADISNLLALLLTQAR